MKTYTIEQIEKYLHSQDSFGDVFYNLKNIDKILQEIEENESIEPKEIKEEY